MTQNGKIVSLRQMRQGELIMVVHEGTLKTALWVNHFHPGTFLCTRTFEGVFLTNKTRATGQATIDW